MSKKEYQNVLEHLTKTNQEFCFLPDGRLISRENCQDMIDCFELASLTSGEISLLS